VPRFAKVYAGGGGQFPRASLIGGNPYGDKSYNNYLSPTAFADPGNAPVIRVNIAVPAAARTNSPRFIKLAIRNGSPPKN
jgi:hypothetical protein